MRHACSAILLCFLTLTGWSQQTADRAASILRSEHGEAGRLDFAPAAHAATTEVFADIVAHLTQADAAHGGEIWLVVSAESGSEHVQLRIPLSSTEDAYGESRSCTTTPEGKDALVFNAGLDEKNFVGFTSASSDTEFHLLLNKYLCRALAAPFRCGTRSVSLTAPWEQWRVGGHTWLEISAAAPAALRVSSASILQTNTAFDRTRCAVVAPSSGLCCVGGKTTQWHCGLAPEGRGWHQVSGDCFHRETGGHCKN